MKSVKTVWNIIVKIISILLLLISLIIVVQKVTNNKESFFGYRIFRVQTGSMMPKYQIGDVILVKEKDPDKIEVGEDVTYLGRVGAMNGYLVTHRVKEIEVVDGVKEFHIQGIANTKEDPIVYGEQINGVVKGRMQILTWICMLLSNRYFFYFGAVLPLTVYIFFRVFKGNYKKKLEKRDATEEASLGINEEKCN